MTALPKLHFTPEEYLEMEVQAEYKSQYVAGEIFAMAGTQPIHGQVAGNIHAALHNRFRDRYCSVRFANICIDAAST